MGDLSEHFSAREFACHCGCGGTNVQVNLIQALEEVRALVDTPIYITSGFRCEAHNKAVGGARKSYHRHGVAADIRSNDLAALYLAVMKVPALKGVGIYLRPGGWLHVDTRRDDAQWAQDENRRPIDFQAAAKILCERSIT